MKKILLIGFFIFVILIISIVFFYLTGYNGAPNSPFIIIDSNDNIFLFYQEDIKNSGESNILKYLKISEDNKITKEGIVINTSTAFNILGFYLNKNDEIGILWYNLTNSPEFQGKDYFKAGWHPYKGDILFMKLNLDTETPKIIISKGIDENEAKKYSRNISEIESSMILQEKTQLLIDKNGYTHILNITGDGHYSNAKLTYLKKNGNEKIVEIKLAEYGKDLLSYLLSPAISSHYPIILDGMLLLDSEENVHICWSINNGSNKFYIFYNKLDKEGETINKVEIG